MGRYVRQYVEVHGQKYPEYGYTETDIERIKEAADNEEYQALLNKLVDKPFDELTEAEWKILQDWE